MSAIALPRLQPNRGRQLAIALLLGAIVLAIAVVAIPFWLLHRHYDTAITDSLDKLERYRRIASTRPIVAKELEAMKGKDTKRFFLRSGAAALSAAEAQEAVRQLVEQSGGRLVTMQAPVSKDDGHYRQMSANVQIAANIFALRKILHAIENNVPYLFVDNLTVRTQAAGNFKPAPGAEPEMFVQFDVSGYSLTGPQ
ncbi:MAG TPA: type II secretion system protein GspM [Usitatibacter sp.]|nr:type II secretion system protein GspM [Usitatibacter sp.]